MQARGEGELVRRQCLLSPIFHTILSFLQPKEAKSQLVPAAPRNQMLQWTSEFQMYLGLQAELNLWQTKQHGYRAAAEERKYQGTGITAPARCLAARSCSKKGRMEARTVPPNIGYPLTPKLHPG